MNSKLLVLVLILLIGVVCPAQPNPKNESPRVHQIRDNVYAILDLYHPSPRIGTNAGIIFTEESVVFIDAGMTARCAKFMWETARDRMKGNEKIYLILTHHHSDHVFGMNVLKEKGARVIAHTMTKAFIDGHGAGYKDFLARKMQLNPEKADSLFGDVILSPPDDVLTGDSVLDFDGERIHILYTPGHVPGELTVYYPKAKVLFAGDAIYEGVDPTIRFGGPSEWRTWISQLERLKKLEVDVMCPGHGGLCGKEEIDRNIEFLKEQLKEPATGEQ